MACIRIRIWGWPPSPCSATTCGVTNDIPAGAVMSGFPARPHGLAKRAQMLAAELPDLFKRLRRLERALGNGGVGNRGEEDDGR